MKVGDRFVPTWTKEALSVVLMGSWVGPLCEVGRGEAGKRRGGERMSAHAYLAVRLERDPEVAVGHRVILVDFGRLRL